MRRFHILKTWDVGTTWCKKSVLHSGEVKEAFHDAEIAASVGALKKFEREEKICSQCIDAIIEALNTMREEEVT